MDIIIGTAGHIDHGKTALVKALTGVDADRLPEEKKRGITIDLGFAELSLGDVKIGFVDVPGHEKFVKNMLAGASGIDLVALVIAADEGVMPQTREHFDICRLLETKSGLIVLTKADLVDEELLELVKLDAEELIQNSFLENAPMIAVSAKSGENIAELKQLLQKLALEIPPRKNEKIARLPIDRSFSVKGFGAVVTGTLITGEIKIGEELELLPIGKKVRVRGAQTHGKQVESAHAGQRTALNLGGIEHSEIERGMILAKADSLRPTQIFDAQIEVLKSARKSVKSRQRVRLHLGTAEVLARMQILENANEIAAGESGLAQFRLESALVAIPGERFIIRSYSPQMTIAGGQILDGLAAKHRRKDFGETQTWLSKLAEAIKTDDKQTQLKLYLETAAEHGLTFKDLQARTAWTETILREVLQEVLTRKSVVETNLQSRESRVESRESGIRNDESKLEPQNHGLQTPDSKLQTQKSKDKGQRTNDQSIFISRTAFENLLTKTFKEIQAHHRNEPLSRGILRETLREKVFSHLPPEIFRKTLQTLVERGDVSAEKDVVRAASYTRNLPPNDKIIFDKLQKIYLDAKLEVPTLENALIDATKGTKTTQAQARKIFQLLLDSGEVIKITEDFYFRREEIAQLIEKLRHFAAHSADKLIDVPQFKEIAKISRKYAIPLLEYFDREKITRRVGDKRQIL